MRPEVPADLNELSSTKAGDLVVWLHAQSGAARWGVSREEFGAALHRSASQHFAGTPVSGEALETYLRALHLEDLALTCALRMGSERAWEEFVARYRPVLYAAARAIAGSAGEAHARDLADSLYAELYGVRGATGERRSLLEYFHGRSKLATWLRTVLAQRHVDALRAAKRIESLDAQEGDGDARRSRATLAAVTPQLRGTTDGCDLDRERLLPRLERAVSLALAELQSTDRSLISLYYVEELTLAEIARSRGVHEATASRHLERVRRELREGVEKILAAGEPAQDGRRGAAGLSPQEIHLCFTYALDDWPLDLRKELSPSAGRAEDKQR